MTREWPSDVEHWMSREDWLDCIATRDAEIERLRDLLAYNGINPDAVVHSAKGADRTLKALKDATS